MRNAADHGIEDPETRRKLGKPAMGTVRLGARQEGDRIVIHAHAPGRRVTRDCKVLEVHGPDGAPPFLVRWGEDGHESLFFPGDDAEVTPYHDAA